MGKLTDGIRKNCRHSMAGSIKLARWCADYAFQLC